MSKIKMKTSSWLKKLTQNQNYYDLKIRNSEWLTFVCMYTSKIRENINTIICLFIYYLYIPISKI